MAARGRKPITVDKVKLQDVLVSVEWDGPLQSRSALWQAVAESDYAKSIKLSPQVAMLKAKAFGDSLMIITPLGKKGFASKTTSKPKSGTKTSLYVYSNDILQAMLKKYPPSMHKRVRAAARGNKTQQIALNCYDCLGGSKSEVRTCTEKICPFWTSRPWQKGRLD